MSNKNIYGCKPIQSSIDNRFHYVYRITNLVENKHYYGKRSSKIHPHLDIGIKYFSSSKDLDFKTDQKTNPQNYKYKVVAVENSAPTAILKETKLHSKFQVGKHESFYNKVTQTGNASVGFDSTGKTNAQDKNGNYLGLVSLTDPRWGTGEISSVRVGFCVPGRVFTESHRKNLSMRSIGKPKQKQHVQKGVQTRKEKKIGVGRNHWKSKYIYHTPWGSFDTPTALEPEFTMQRMKNMCLNNQGIMTNKSYYSCEKLVQTQPPSIIGKSYKEIGFSVTDLQKS